MKKKHGLKHISRRIGCHAGLGICQLTPFIEVEAATGLTSRAKVLPAAEAQDSVAGSRLQHNIARSRL